MRYLRHHDRTDFCLYTDSLCNYGFYERRGMTRAASEDMRLRLDGDVEDLGVYLYAGKVPEESR